MFTYVCCIMMLSFVTVVILTQILSSFIISNILLLFWFLFFLILLPWTFCLLLPLLLLWLLTSSIWSWTLMLLVIHWVLLSRHPLPPFKQYWWFWGDGCRCSQQEVAPDGAPSDGGTRTPFNIEENVKHDIDATHGPWTCWCGWYPWWQWSWSWSHVNFAPSDPKKRNTVLVEYVPVRKKFLATCGLPSWWCQELFSS